ncbi:MAG: 30S ribosomal protein S5 [Patescibacteria group bacterium]|nr:30S ribosomal protein S5 [Patescibacteria group bacterium]
MARPKTRGGGRRGHDRDAERDFAQEIIAVDRVTRVMAGGKRMRFRACVAIGMPQGNRVGIGVAKGADVTGAVNKAVTQARKHLVSVPIVHETIPYPVRVKYKGAEILLKPAPLGTGVKVGGAVRTVLKLAQVPNVVGKMLGTSNKISNVRATMVAFRELQRIPVPQSAPDASKKPKDTAEATS